MAAVRLVALIACIAALVACSRGYKPKACEKPKEYHEQKSIPPLVVPDDLDAPDPSAALGIPELPGGETAGPTPGPCLEEPPDYFDTSAA